MKVCLRFCGRNYAESAVGKMITATHFCRSHCTGLQVSLNDVIICLQVSLNDVMKSDVHLSGHIAVILVTL